MTTRRGSRIYRGAAPAPDDATTCPVCHRRASVSPGGRRRAHRDMDGVDCPGGGIPTAETSIEIDPDAVAAALAAPPQTDRGWSTRDRTRANPWSGKP